MPDLPLSKKDLLLALLARGSTFIRLDGRVDGVALPDWLRSDPGVVLQIGYDLAVPIPDLRIDDEGISATLSFRRTPMACHVPWPAVYAIADSEGRGILFPEDAPADAQVTGGPAPEPEPPPAPAGKPRKARPSHLKLVD